MPDTPIPKISEVIGKRAREIRQESGATQEDVAAIARDCGMNWDSGRVSQIEQGRSSMSVETLIVLAHALGRARNQPVSLWELIEILPGGRDGNVIIGIDMVTTNQARQWFLGDPVATLDRSRRMMNRDHIGARIVDVMVDLAERGPGVRDRSDALFRLADALRSTGSMEQRIAHKIGVSTDAIASFSILLWGHSIREERDKRTPPGAAPQKRGQITRVLTQELEQSIETESARRAHQRHDEKDS
ncbi:helix-turn-helix transcriptional regulator [Rhodococcus erythropolis]|uniref:helix-turn-helix domain-containing protein n=1 Tax=Rhodococcus erythropolis TaxID=1833 RepID=UPI0033B06E2A